jgi:hypothetical protein
MIVKIVAVIVVALSSWMVTMPHQCFFVGHWMEQALVRKLRRAGLLQEEANL